MDLRSNQIKDTYGNLLTVGTSAGSPTTGTVENGQGSDITDLTVNGTLNATTINGAITGTLSDGNTSSSVDYNSETITVQGTENQTDVSLSGQAFTVASAYNQQNPNIRVNMFTPTSLTNSTNNYVGFSGSLKGPNNATTTYELVNSGQATSTGARVHVKEPGQYLFNVYAKLNGLGNGTEVFINITESTSSSGTMSSAKGIVQHIYSHNAMTAIATGTIFLYNNNTNNYYSFYINPSSNTPTLEFAELQIIRLSPV